MKPEIIQYFDDLFRLILKGTFALAIIITVIGGLYLIGKSFHNLNKD